MIAVKIRRSLALSHAFARESIIIQQGSAGKNTLGGITKRFPTMASNLAGISAAANYFEF
jgi:hypothetical protein